MVEQPLACDLDGPRHVRVRPVHWMGPSLTQMKARRRARVHHEGYRGYWHQRWGPYFQGPEVEEVGGELLDVLLRLMPVPRLGVEEDSTMVGLCDQLGRDHQGVEMA